MKNFLTTCITALLVLSLMTACGKPSEPSEQISQQTSTTFVHADQETAQETPEILESTDVNQCNSDSEQTEVPTPPCLAQDTTKTDEVSDVNSDTSYFDDAAFIGNSRTEGMRLFGGLTNAKYLSQVGLMVDTVFTDKCFDGEKTAMEALADMPFSKVYIMLGINELGWSYPQIFKEKYSLIIDEIKNINPNAVVYVQSILPVTMQKSTTDSVYNLENINKFNALLVELAQEKNVIYVDISSEIADGNGYLPADGNTDGAHLNAVYCQKWKNYLVTHTAK